MLKVRARVETLIKHFHPVYCVCSTMRVLSTVGVLSTMGCSVSRGDIMSTMEGYLEYRGGVQYRGGYYPLKFEYRGDSMIHVGDIMSTVGVFSTLGYSNNKKFPSTVLNTLHSTHDIPHVHHDISTVLIIPTVIKITPTVIKITPTVLMISPRY